MVTRLHLLVCVCMRVLMSQFEEKRQGGGLHGESQPQQFQLLPAGDIYHSVILKCRIGAAVLSHHICCFHDQIHISCQYFAAAAALCMLFALVMSRLTFRSSKEAPTHPSFVHAHTFTGSHPAIFSCCYMSQS